MIRALILSSALSVIALGGAIAADLPTEKGPPAYEPPPPPAFSWTGFYFGVNGGYGGNNVSGNFYDPFTFVEPADDDDEDGSINANAKLTTGGFLGGGTVGYNFQFPGSNFVAGFEGDFDGSTIKGEADIGAGITEGPDTEQFSAGVGSRLNWLATARLRLGYAVTTPIGDMMPYVTGGAAFGNVTNFVNLNVTEDGDSIENAGLSWNHTWTGWTVGAGLEYAITQNLTFKTEYMYVDLGSHSILGDLGGLEDDLDPGASLNEHWTVHIVRAGLNWKFDWFEPPAPAPVVAKY